jgi:ribosome-associated toxin RatA of RatAB toxin-antitoxin module
MDVRKTVLVAHSAAQMFDLIERAERYPEFLPWCAAATIVERDAGVVAADITVDVHGIRFHFRTRNPKRAPEWMALTLEHGPFHHFEGEWNLRPLGTHGCRIDFVLRYAFKSGIAGKLAAPVFDRIANTLVDAFVTRADHLYGTGGTHGGTAPAAASPESSPPDARPPEPAPAAASPPNTTLSAAAGGGPYRSDAS